MPLNIRIARVSQDAWACAAIQHVFAPRFCEAILNGLEELPWAEAVQSFYRQREVDLRQVKYYQDLFDQQVRHSIAEKIGLFFGVRIAPDFEVAAHKMIAGDFIGVHTDANRHQETHRMAVTLNKDWKTSDGGVLLALNGTRISDIRDAWLPTFNNGFLFAVSERSFHAVSPVAGSRPRYSLILSFRQLRSKIEESVLWTPFPLASDLRCAASTADYMGIEPETFESEYRFLKFDSVHELERFVDGELENAPSQWSYRFGKSMNVDEQGIQSKGSDAERMRAIAGLSRVPPVIIVRRRNGEYTLVDGSHRLSFAADFGSGIGVVIFDEH